MKHTDRHNRKIILVITFLLGLCLGGMLILLLVKFYPMDAETSTNHPQIIIREGSVSKDEIEDGAEEIEDGAEEIEDQSQTLVENQAVNDSDVIKALQESLENGDGTLASLRKVFTDQIMVVSNGGFYFFPIDETVPHHDYKEENLSISDQGELSYTFEDGAKALKGIDVSKYQGSIDWTKVKNDGVNFAFIRGGLRGYETGKIVLEENFAANVVGASDAGIDVGIYFFSQAINTEEAIEEADVMIDSLSGNQIPYPIVFDLERVRTGRMKELTKDEMTEICLAFCNRIKEASYTPMIYGNIETFTMLLDMTKLNDVDKWLAYYNPDFYYPYDFSIWQYTEKGTVDGIEGEVDMNLAFKKYTLP